MDFESFTWHTKSDALFDLQYGLSLAQNSGAKSLLILTCQQNNYPEEELNALLSSCPLTLFGGAYPMLTLQDTLIEQGALIIGFEESFDVTIFSDLYNLTDEEHLEKLITSTLEQKNNFSGQDNFLIFYDALINNIENFIDCLFECLDHGINIGGGGAGNLEFTPHPCVFTNQGVHSEVVVLVALAKKLNTSTAHGWNIFQGPFLVSEAQGQTVQSLNYQPAFEVYTQAIENSSEHRFNNQDNFFDIAKHFPLGIEDINNNLIIRETISIQNNHLLCGGNIPVNSMIYLLNSDKDSLISSTEQAAISVFSAQENPPATKISNNISNKDKAESSTTIIFACVSRELYMEDVFTKELKVIAKHCPTPALFGALSLGEIANCQSGAIRLLNKSIVICSW